MPCALNSRATLSFGPRISAGPVTTSGRGIAKLYARVLAEVDLPDPEKVGVDRILNAAAAYQRIKDAVAVVDAGTAITVDCVSPEGVFLGGAILPGFNTSLHRFKALFPQVDFSDPVIDDNSLPGRSTAATTFRTRPRRIIAAIPSSSCGWRAGGYPRVGYARLRGHAGQPES